MENYYLEVRANLPTELYGPSSGLITDKIGIVREITWRLKRAYRDILEIDLNQLAQGYKLK